MRSNGESRPLSIMDVLDWREPANDNSRSCLTCGCGFIPNKHNQKYCSKECRDKKIRKRDRKGEPRGGPERTCEHCGVTFRRRADRKNAARFCSRQCGYAARAHVPDADPVVSDELRTWADAQRASFRIAKCRCRVCGLPFIASTRATTYCSDECRHTAHWVRRGVDTSDRECAWCKATFSIEYGRAQAIYCSASCAKKSARNSPSARAAKAKRKAMARGAGDNDNVDPLEVFERDGWKCQLCGVKTPKKLRGSYDERAPELDHICPISLGGSHTYDNVQCACRACNGAKGARFIGQMRLFG